MASSNDLPQYHVLNFFRDNDDGCALTVLVHHVRHHIIVDPSRLSDRSTGGKKIASTYKTLLHDLKELEAQEAEEEQEQDSRAQDAQSSSHETQDSGVDVSNDKQSRKASPSASSTHNPRKALYEWILHPLTSTFADHRPASSSSSSSSKHERTVQKWYYCETHFHHLATSPSGELTAKEEQPSASLFSRMQQLVPSLPLPKYIRKLDIPMVSAAQLAIKSESADPDPIHPAVVRDRRTDASYFLKVVDPTQPQPTKREIKLMKEIEAKGLHERMRVPRVRALVYFDEEAEREEKGSSSSSSSFSSARNDHEGTNSGADVKAQRGKGKPIMGFLMDAIDEPTPLTHMLDVDVAQERREKWAAESSRMVELLHENGIVWGDAKGDNFVVDKNDELWIIDFGGSYTPGWIDPELNETEEGDDQGMTKLVNGLTDPENNTVEYGDEDEAETERDVRDETGEDEGEATDEENKATAGQKRKAHQLDDGDDVDLNDNDEAANKADSKKLKRSDDDNDASSCVCGGPESGAMIACDGKGCETEWFHMACVGLDEAPEGNWYCESCASSTE